MVFQDNIAGEISMLQHGINNGMSTYVHPSVLSNLCDDRGYYVELLLSKFSIT